MSLKNSGTKKTMMNKAGVCASCRQHKYRLIAKNSRLKPDQALLLCESCIKSKFEPRWIIMMVGRDEGLEAVKDWVRPKRYVGEPILLEDLC